jgi:hypothetical protein
MHVQQQPAAFGDDGFQQSGAEGLQRR